MSYHSFRQYSRASRAAARQTLGADGVRLHLISASLFWLALSASSLFLIENLFAVVPWARLYNTDPARFYLLNQAFYWVDGLIVLLIALPLVYGLLGIFFGAAQGETRPAASLFSPFCRASDYVHSVARMGAIFAPRVAGVLALIRLFRGVMARTAPTERILGFVCCAAALLLLVWLLGLGDALLWLSLQPENQELWLPTLLIKSARMTWRHLGKLVCFKLSFLHWGILSLASVGVLFFLHALPYYTLSHLFLMEGLSNKKGTSDGRTE